MEQEKKRLTFDDLKKWDIVYSESKRIRYEVWAKIKDKVYLKSITSKYYLPYSKYYINDNFFH